MKKKSLALLMAASIIASTGATVYARGIPGQNTDSGMIVDSGDYHGPTIMGKAISYRGGRGARAGWTGQASLETPSQKEIADMYNQIDFDTMTTAPISYSSLPVVTPANALQAGKLSDSSLQDGLNAVNLVRFIAGIDSVSLDEGKSELAQHASVVLACVGDGLSHELEKDGYKPDGIAEDFFEKAAKGANKSNLAAGTKNITAATLMYMDDSDDGNIGALGHRRWLLNPSAQTMGFGFASNPNSKYKSYSATHVVGDSGSQHQPFEVMWPAQQMPEQLFKDNQAWSASIGSNFDAPSVSTVKVTLTKRGGRSWTFQNGGSDGYFNIDTSNRGLKNTIIFRPDSVSCTAGDVFDIKIEGLTQSGQATDPLTYTVRFFDIENPSNGGDSDDNNSSKPDDNNSSKPDDNNSSKPDDNNSSKPDDDNSSKPEIPDRPIFPDIPSDRPIQPVFPGNIGGTGSTGGSGGSGGGSSSSKSGGPASILNSTGSILGNLNSTAQGSGTKVTASSLEKQVTQAMKNAKANGAASASVVLNNVQILPADALAAAVKAAQANQGQIRIFADTKDAWGKIHARLYLDPAALPAGKAVNLTVNAANAEAADAVKAFNRHYKNKAVAVCFGQKGTFGAEVSVAVKVNLNGLNVKTLQFYQLDAQTGAYKQMADPGYYIDQNGYLHFNTMEGGTVLITDKSLVK